MKKLTTKIKLLNPDDERKTLGVSAYMKIKKV